MQSDQSLHERKVVLTNEVFKAFGWALFFYVITVICLIIFTVLVISKNINGGIFSLAFLSSSLIFAKYYEYKGDKLYQELVTIYKQILKKETNNVWKR